MPTRQQQRPNARAGARPNVLGSKRGPIRAGNGLKRPRTRWRKPALSPRLAAILPVSEEAIVLYQPLVLPVAISVLGLLLISAGAHQPKPQKVPKRKGKRKRKPRLGKGPQPSSNVVPCGVEFNHTPVVHAAGVFILCARTRRRPRSTATRMLFCDTSAQALRAVVECKDVPWGAPLRSRGERMISRRGLIAGMASLLAAPVIVRVTSIMPVKALPLETVWRFAAETSVRYRLVSVDPMGFGLIEPIVPPPASLFKLLEELRELNASMTHDQIMRCIDACIRKSTDACPNARLNFVGVGLVPLDDHPPVVAGAVFELAVAAGLPGICSPRRPAFRGWSAWAYAY